METADYDPLRRASCQNRLYRRIATSSSASKALAIVGSKATNFEVTDSLEWMARITSHIPRKGSKQVIYYGMYSHAWRGRERRQGISPTEHDQTVLSEEEDTPRSGRGNRMWAILLKRVWDIDALECPRCGGRMKAISVMERPTVIRRILEHLDLWVEEEPRSPPEPLELVCEPDADYVPWRDDVPEIEAG